jgi:predicted PurR-regulated permease PerM
VGVVSFVIQQVEGALLLPRIVGKALDLDPLIVFISLFAGGALAGLFGVILAAPVAASARLIGGYIWRKLLDKQPFPPWEPETPLPPLRETLRGLDSRLRRLGARNQA